MALEYNVSFSNTAKLGDKIIKFRPWTTKNEKDYLIAIESDTDVDDSMLFDILVRPCIEDPNIVLSPNEKKMLIIEIRKKSIGPTFPMRYTCNDCSNVNDIDVDFNNVVNFKAESFESVEIGDLKFNFGPVLTETLNNKLKNISSNIEYSFIDFLIHVNSIEINGTLEDTFTFDELTEFVENLPTFIFDEVFDKYIKMKSTLDFDLRTICASCGNENHIGLENIPNFLWA